MNFRDTIHSFPTPKFEGELVFAKVVCTKCGQVARIYKFDTHQIFYYDVNTRLHRQPGCGKQTAKNARNSHSFEEYKRDDEYIYKKCACGVKLKCKINSTYAMYYHSDGITPFAQNKADKCTVMIEESEIKTKRHYTVQRSELTEGPSEPVIIITPLPAKQEEPIELKADEKKDSARLFEAYLCLALLTLGHTEQAREMALKITQSDDFTQRVLKFKENEKSDKLS